MSDNSPGEHERASSATDLPKQMLDAIGQAVAAWDLDGRIIYANRAAEELFGGRRDSPDIRIDDFLPLLRPVDDAPAVVDITRRGEAWTGETRLVGRDRDSFIAGVVQRPLYDESGVPSGAVAVITDASGRRRDENALLVAAAYELRSPLAVIRGYLSTITEYHERLSATEIVDLVARSQAAVAQLEKLVNDLLLLAKLDAGALPRSMRVVPLRDVVVGAVDQLRVAHPLRDFVFRSDATDTRVRGDRGQLRNVIADLLGNALKYSPEATPIEIAMATPGDGTVCITIRDRGPGVPADELDRIFSRFHRVRTAGNATVAGAGLGLAVCRGLIERHGGRIEASAPADGGLAVTFTLPLSTRKPKQS